MKASKSGLRAAIEAWGKEGRGRASRTAENVTACSTRETLLLGRRWALSPGPPQTLVRFSSGCSCPSMPQRLGEVGRYPEQQQPRSKMPLTPSQTPTWMDASEWPRSAMSRWIFQAILVSSAGGGRKAQEDDGSCSGNPPLVWFSGAMQARRRRPAPPPTLPRHHPSKHRRHPSHFVHAAPCSCCRALRLLCLLRAALYALRTRDVQVDAEVDEVVHAVVKEGVQALNDQDLGRLRGVTQRSAAWRSPAQPCATERLKQNKQTVVSGT